MGQARLAIAFLFAFAGSAVAQDSVSRNANGGSGLPGDAFSAWSSGSQRASFVLDLAPLRSAWGVSFGVGPILKSSKTSAARFSSLPISASISQALATGPYPSPSFTLWSAPGGGLNSIENNTSLNSVVNPSGSASLFGVAALDIDEVTAGTALVFSNNIFGATVAFDPALPTRLFVTRAGAASNMTNGTQPDRSQFGLGSIDAEGNLCFRADGFGAAAPASLVLRESNYFRVRLPARSTSVNVIDDAGASHAAASEWVLTRLPVTTAAPAAIPATLAGRSVLTGADFTGLLYRETAVNSMTPTASHRPATLDHRGCAAVSAAPLFPGAVASGAVISRSASGSGRPDAVSVFGLDASGGVLSPRTIVLPPAIADACTGTPWPLSGGSIRGYDSQATFRGGVGPVAITRDLSGLGLIACTLYSGSVPAPASPFNALAVARFDPLNPGAPPLWSIAAWVDSSSGTGKQILGDYGPDGVPNTADTGEGDGVIDGPIGRLASMSESPLGFAGPSMSAPAFDAAGNLYFLASAAFNRAGGGHDFDLGLFRAVYDPSTVCYSLDLLLRVGSVFQGQNSARNYRVDSLFVADSDSASSASLWSSSTTQQAWNNADTTALAPVQPQHLGGLVLAARITYDANADGLFQDPSLPGGNLASPDESYNVVLYVGNTTPIPDAGCDADFNQDGVADQDDVAYLINVIGGGPNPSGRDPDFDLNGVADQDDIAALINVIAGGNCP